MTYTGIFLDLDETLLAGHRFPESVQSTCRELATLSQGLDAARLNEANSTVWPEYYNQIEQAWMLGKVTGIEVLYGAWSRTLAACGNHDQTLAEFAVNAHREAYMRIYERFEDVTPLLSFAKSTGRILVIITNGAEDTQSEKIRALGLHTDISGVVYSGRLGIAKPAREPFEAALDLTGLQRQEVMHVGDNLHTDVQGANNAGITSVWLNRNGQQCTVSDPQPDIEIASLTTLVNYL